MSSIRDFADIPFDQEEQFDIGAGLIEESPEDTLAGFGPMQGFEESFPRLMVPRAKRKELAQQNYPKQKRTVRNIYAQLRTSACVGFGTAQATETYLTRRYGRRNHVALAGMDVYKDIGRTLMSGAYIRDGMKRAAEYGVHPLDTEANREKFNFFWGNTSDWYYKKRPSNFPSVAPIRVARFATAEGADEIESALINGFTGIVGRSRHCVPYVGLTYDGNSPYAAYANSWGKSWGDKGFGYDSRRTYGNLVLYVILDIIVPEFLYIPKLV